jgi:acetyl esterase/lipase
MRGHGLVPVFAVLVCLCFGQTGHGDKKDKGAKKFNPPPGVVYCPDMPYCQHGKEPQLLDLAYPKAKGPFPAVVVIHGTGPMTKGRKYNIPLIFELAKKGYVGVAVSFRHKAEDGFPAPCHDVKCAIRFLRARAGNYHIDSERIAALGFSGGGSLACLLGFTKPGDDLEGKEGHADQSSAVQAVISYFAPADLTQFHADCCRLAKVGDFFQVLQAKILVGQLEKWLGGPPGKIKPRYAQASPLTYVRKGVPPVLLLHGADDDVVSLEQSKALFRKIKAVGGKVNLLTFEAPHDFDERGDLNARVAALAVLAFLEEHLKPSGTGKQADRDSPCR